MATLQQDPLPYNVPLHKAAQRVCHNSLWFWIRWELCFSDILGASELDIWQRKPRW